LMAYHLMTKKRKYYFLLDINNYHRCLPTYVIDE
jgi:hypothetical protein